MERYADVLFYKRKHKGKFQGTSRELERLLGLASRKADTLTHGRIMALGWENLTAFQREMVRFAVCFQADYCAEHGEDGETPVSGYTAAGVSVKFDGKADAAERARFSRTGYELLEQSGLMWQGV